jgi:hypothetical protein
VVLGGAGNDDVRGGRDNDQLRGGAGNDTLEGGVDADTFTGGGQDDLFVTRPGASPAATQATIFENDATFDRSALIGFGNGVDIITDFNVLTENDRIDFSDSISSYDPFAPPLQSPFFEDIQAGEAYILSGRWTFADNGVFNACTFEYVENGPDYLFFVATITNNNGFDAPDPVGLIGTQVFVLLDPSFPPPPAEAL